MTFLVGDYVIIPYLSADEYSRALENTQYLGEVKKKCGKKYEIRVIGEVELLDGEYCAADYEEDTRVQRDIEEVQEIPPGTTIFCS